MEKLHPKAVWLFFVRFLLRGLILFFILGSWLAGILTNIFYPGYKETTPGVIRGFIFVLLFVFILYVVLCWVWAKLTYHFWRYELTDDTFKKECGVIWKKYISIPYERIQNVDIYRGVFDRFFGLSELQIQTAGYSGGYSSRHPSGGVSSEGRLPGIDRGAAEQLREELVRRLKGKRQGL